MCAKDTRDRVSIDTNDRHLDRHAIDTRSNDRSVDISVATRSTVGRHIGRQSVDSRRTVGRQTFYFR